LRQQDVAVDASTGSGKTLAFLVPVVERLRRLEEPLRRHQARTSDHKINRSLCKKCSDEAYFVDVVKRFMSRIVRPRGSHEELWLYTLLMRCFHIIYGMSLIESVLSPSPGLYECMFRVPHGFAFNSPSHKNLISHNRDFIAKDHFDIPSWT
jgi:hypothetical protein